MQETSQSEMKNLLERQREAYLAEGVVSAATRIDRLQRAIAVLKNYEKQFVEAMSADFGHRSEHQSLFTDIASSVGPLKHALSLIHISEPTRPPSTSRMPSSA